MKDEEEIRLNGRRIGLRAAAFFMVLAIAVGAFGLGIRGLRERTAGYYPVEPKEEEESIRYAAQVALSCYFTGNSTEIRTAQTRLQREYGRLLVRYSHLLEPWETYEGSGNLALLNRSPGETVRLDPALLPILAEALAWTEEGLGYSLFAGPFYREWNTLLYLDEPEVLDPLWDEGEAERLQALAELAGDPSAFRLTVLDGEEGAARLEISAAAQEKLEELEYEGPILDLNLLREAFLLRLLAEDLEALGCHAGYLAGAEGTALALSGNRAGDYCLYGFHAGQAEAAAIVPAAPGSVFCQLHAFAWPGEEYGYYILTEGEDRIFRHPYVPCTGIPAAGGPRSACVWMGNGDPAATRYACLLLFFQSNEESPGGGEALDFPAAWTNGEAWDRTVFQNAAAAGHFTIPEDASWRFFTEESRKFF